MGPEPELAPLLDGQSTPLAELDQRLEAGTLTVEQYRDLHARHRTLIVECRHGFEDMRRLRREAEEDIDKLERAHVRPLIENVCRRLRRPLGQTRHPGLFSRRG